MDSNSDPGTPVQRRILLIGAALIIIALLFPPWSNTSGASRGFNFLFLPLIKNVPARVNSSLLFLEIAGIAIATWFVSRASRNLPPPILRLVTYIVVVSVVLVLCAFGWFVWPRWYTEYDGVRTQRLTGTRYRWSDLSRSWLTDLELDAQLRATAEDNRRKAKPVLEELRLIRFGGEHNDIDQVNIYNPTHWQLPYGAVRVRIELYLQQNRKLILLKIADSDTGIEPGLNHVYLRDMQDFSGYAPLVQKIKITASSARSTDDDRSDTLLLPPFEIQRERSCDRDPDPNAYSYMPVCR
jgi:hypothetical protein